MYDCKNNKNQSPLGNSTIVVVTLNHYLFHGLKALMASITPKLLSENSMFYDVICVNSIEDLNNNKITKEKGNILITDFDPRLCVASKKDRSVDAILGLFDGITFISKLHDYNNEVPLFLSSHASLDETCSRLLEITRRTLSGQMPSVQQIHQYLSHDEALLLSLIMNGFQPPMMAKMLKMNVKQIYAHRSRLYRKAGVKSLQELYTQLGCG
ncbi:TPA: hypothetical protein QH025_001174 [Enterobacter cancerogenus]|nr:hypothetical protein [Enterobacter cancerogenus]